jgi:hypothetical protein
VEPKGLLVVPGEVELLGLPNTLGDVLVGAADLPENMLFEGTPNVFGIFKLEDGAEIPFVFGAKGFEVGAEGAPKTLGDGFSDELGVVTPKVNPEGMPNTLEVG